MCDEEVPQSPNNTIKATNDALSRRKSEPDWNSYLKKVKYSCPPGHVLEQPNNDTEQDLGIAEFEVMCDSDRHWRPVLSYNPFPNPPIMPECKRKWQYSKECPTWLQTTFI